MWTLTGRWFFVFIPWTDVGSTSSPVVWKQSLFFHQPSEAWELDTGNSAPGFEDNTGPWKPNEPLAGNGLSSTGSSPASHSFLHPTWVCSVVLKALEEAKVTEFLLRKELWTEKKGFSATDTPPLDCSSQREFLCARLAVPPFPVCCFNFIRGFVCRTL